MNKVVIYFLVVIVVSFIFALPLKADSLLDKYIGGLNEGYGTAIYTNVKSNLQQILLCELAYQKDHGKYINCPPNPKEIPSKEALLWETGHHYDAWKDLGFELKGTVNYQYMVTNAGRDTFRAIAKGDRDGDGVYHVITITEQGIITEVNAGE
jgi:hypothetical protein